jgi:hypothetical protein
MEILYFISQIKIIWPPPRRIMNYPIILSIFEGFMFLSHNIICAGKDRPYELY